MVDIPVTTEDASGIIIYGVESEQIEEENDAYNDMRAELGKLLLIKQKRFTELNHLIKTSWFYLFILHWNGNRNGNRNEK